MVCEKYNNNIFEFILNQFVSEYRVIFIKTVGNRQNFITYWSSTPCVFIIILLF